MGMKKALTRIFSKRKSQDGDSDDPASGAPSSAAVSTKDGVVSLGVPQGGPTPAVPRRAPLSALDQLSVVLNPPKPDPERALAGGKSRGATREARAATKIQAAYRGHLVRRSVRTHKSVVKVQALVRGHIVRRQAAITLRCMNALVRVQARARAHAVRNSATGREVQQHLEAVGYRQQADGVGKTRADGWVHGSAPIHDLQADYHRRQTGFIKRERARAYAASFQKWKSEPAPKTVTYIPNDPDHEGWGWGWLERWMVARPWRNRSFIDASDLTRKEWAPPRRVVSDNGDGGAHLYRRLSAPGSFPAKVVDREEPNLARDVGEPRQCKWCGRHSTRVKDTEAGPLCGVCQLNTATAARLNKDPYAQTGTKIAKQESAPTPVKAVEWEAPKVSLRPVGEVRQCKWCGRMSNRVKDTQGGPLCGVCQLNTATATRLNRDPYTPTPPKVEALQVDSPSPSSARSRTLPAPLALPRKAATPSPTAPLVERRQSFPASPKVTGGSPIGGSPASTPKSVMSPMGTPRFMQPTASSLPKFRTSTNSTSTSTPSPSPRLKSTSTAERAKQAAAVRDLTPPPLDTTTSITRDDGRQEAAIKGEPALAADVDAARVSLESALLAAAPGDETANGNGAMLAHQEAGEGTAPDGKGSPNKHVMDGVEHAQGAEQAAAKHSKSAVPGWPNSNGAPVIAQ